MEHLPPGARRDAVGRPPGGVRRRVRAGHLHRRPPQHEGLRSLRAPRRPGCRDRGDEPRRAERLLRPRGVRPVVDLPRHAGRHDRGRDLGHGQPAHPGGPRLALAGARGGAPRPAGARDPARGADLEQALRAAA